MTSTALPKFEASFSNGLDLSELVSSSSVKNNDNNASPKIESASAELLRIKQKEVSVKEREEHQELMMQQKAAIKAKEQLRRLEDCNKREEKKSDEFYGVLVSMHVSDTSGGKKERKHAKTKAQKRTVVPKFKKNTQENAKNRKNKTRL